VQLRLIPIGLYNELDAKRLFLPNVIDFGLEQIIIGKPMKVLLPNCALNKINNIWAYKNPMNFKREI
tara:strand:- start:54 stop:254 length:201 start_codon:yes stop_codon:yes gene_type:complete